MVSRLYPIGDAQGQPGCAAPASRLPPPCGFGEDAVGSPTPCIGLLEYEAPFVGANTTYLNDFTSFRPPEARLAGYDAYTPIARPGSDDDHGYAPLRGADPATASDGLPDGNPLASAGPQPVFEQKPVPLRGQTIGPQARWDVVTDPGYRQAPWLVEDRAA